MGSFGKLDLLDKDQTMVQGMNRNSRNIFSWFAHEITLHPIYSEGLVLRFSIG